MSKPINQIHLAVYNSLMNWRRVMYVESDDKTKVMGVAGEAWHWAALTEGDLKFIAKEVAKLESLSKPEPEKPGAKVAVKVEKTQDQWKPEEDLTV